MKKLTLDEFMEFNPCYSKEKIQKLMGRRKYLTAKNILLSGIPNEDKLWSVLRPEFIDEPTLHEFACLCAEEALKLVDKPDPRSVEAIRVKRLWIKGEATDFELSAAESAAMSAAMSAAESAVRSAESAAWSAAESAAESAAMSAAESAAMSAAESAVRSAESAAWSAESAARSAAESTAWPAARSAAESAESTAWPAARSAWSAQIKLLIDMLEDEK